MDLEPHYTLTSAMTVLRPTIKHQEMGIPDHLTCHMRNLFAGQEATENQTWNKGLVQNWERSRSRLYIVTLLIYLCLEYIMRNARLDEGQVGIKIARRNINNFRYADDTTLMAECEE